MDNRYHKLSIVYINGLSICIRDYPGEYDIENRRGWIEQHLRSENIKTRNNIVPTATRIIATSLFPASIEQFKPNANTFKKAIQVQKREQVQNQQYVKQYKK